MNKADLIKQRLDIQELVGRLGIEPDRSSFIRCPAHEDKTPSLKLYEGGKGWYCFSCRAGGSVIDFYMHYMQVDFKRAVDDLGAFCGLTKDLTVSEKVNLRRAASSRDTRKTEQALAKQRFAVWLGYKKTLEQQYSPDEPYPPELVEACQNIARAEFLAFERR